MFGKMAAQNDRNPKRILRSSASDTSDDQKNQEDEEVLETISVLTKFSSKKKEIKIDDERLLVRNNNHLRPKLYKSDRY